MSPSLTPRRLIGDRCRRSGCGQHFKSTAAHAKHRVGPYAPINKPDTRRCLSPEQMQAKGMSVNAAGYWITATRPMLPNAPARAASAAEQPAP